MHLWYEKCAKDFGGHIKFELMPLFEIDWQDGRLKSLKHLNGDLAEIKPHVDDSMRTTTEMAFEKNVYIQIDNTNL